MSYGYSTRLVTLNKAANARNLGVKLGRVCIRHDYSVSKIASTLGVSRQTIYNWFCGSHEPNDAAKEAIIDFIHSA